MGETFQEFRRFVMSLEGNIGCQQLVSFFRQNWLTEENVLAARGVEEPFTVATAHLK